MEITSSLDANPLLTPSQDSSTDAGTDANQPSRLPNHRLSAPTSKPTLVLESSPSILTEELAGIKLSHTKQKGDCLYLYSQDREVNCATKIIEAIAPSTQDLDSSVLYAEGIHRLKLHGNAWALGLDLPIAPSALIAAEIIAALLTNFRQDPQLAPKLAQTKLKLLLQNNCLNLLCETRTAILQAEIALPMLNTLRAVSASEYFQSVTVSSRVIGEKKPSWSFEIDLLAIGLQNSNDDEQSAIENEQEQSIEFISEDVEEANAWQKLSGYAGTKILVVGQAIFGLKWLGQTEPKMLSLSACMASLAIGIGTTIVAERTLSNYAQSDQSAKLIIADSKIDVSVNQPETSPEKGFTNKPAPNFNIALFNEKLALLDWQTTNKRSPEVLIVGSSRALRGIEPKTLEKTLSNKGYKNVSVFNLGIDGATAKVVNLQITQILSQSQRPRLIIWADGLRAFNSSRNDLTYEEITASVGYKQLQETLKDKERNLDPIANQSAIAATTAPNPIATSFDLLFTTFSKRQEIRTSLVQKFDRNTHMLSNSEALIAATMPSTVTALDPKGFVAFDVTFDPNTYFQKFPQVPGDYDLDYRNFETNGSQFEAFANVVDFCRRNNIELLVVNMPLHATYLDQIRTQYEAIFNGRMQELALREGFTYLDLSQAIINQSDLFSDPSHLNKKGAIAISQLLAQNPKVRWQVLTKNGK
jgi:hypothetical protein